MCCVQPRHASVKVLFQFLHAAHHAGSCHLPLLRYGFGSWPVHLRPCLDCSRRCAGQHASHLRRSHTAPSTLRRRARYAPPADHSDEPTGHSSRPKAYCTIHYRTIHRHTIRRDIHRRRNRDHTDKDDANHIRMVTHNTIYPSQNLDTN